MTAQNFTAGNIKDELQNHVNESIKSSKNNQKPPFKMAIDVEKANGSRNDPQNSVRSMKSGIKPPTQLPNVALSERGSKPKSSMGGARPQTAKVSEVHKEPAASVKASSRKNEGFITLSKKENSQLGANRKSEMNQSQKIPTLSAKRSSVQVSQKLSNAQKLDKFGQLLLAQVRNQLVYLGRRLGFDHILHQWLDHAPSVALGARLHAQQRRAQGIVGGLVHGCPVPELELFLGLLKRGQRGHRTARRARGRPRRARALWAVRKEAVESLLVLRVRLEHPSLGSLARLGTHILEGQHWRDHRAHLALFSATR